MSKVPGRVRRYPIEQRFWSKVDTSGGPDACWPWLRSVTKEGYGQFNVDGQMYLASIVALELAVGVRPEGMEAMHSCDNPPCCNPDHLSWGTRQQNIADRVSRGRSHRAPGSANPFAKLTEEIVTQARKRYIPGHRQHGASAIAREVGISIPAMIKAISGRNWKHL